MRVRFDPNVTFKNREEIERLALRLLHHPPYKTFFLKQLLTDPDPYSGLLIWSQLKIRAMKPMLMGSCGSGFMSSNAGEQWSNNSSCLMAL